MHAGIRMYVQAPPSPPSYPAQADYSGFSYTLLTSSSDFFSAASACTAVGQVIAMPMSSVQFDEITSMMTAANIYIGTSLIFVIYIRYLPQFKVGDESYYVNCRETITVPHGGRSLRSIITF